MADETTQKRSTRAKGAKTQAEGTPPADDAAAADAANPTSQAELPADPTSPAGSTPVATAPEQGETGDAADDTPPAPPLGTQEGDDQSIDPQAEFSHARLIAHGTELLGVSGAIVQGVLSDAPDPITFTDAQERISAFLDGPVVNTDETDEEA